MDFNFIPSGTQIGSGNTQSEHRRYFLLYKEGRSSPHENLLQNISEMLMMESQLRFLRTTQTLKAFGLMLHLLGICCSDSGAVLEKGVTGSWILSAGNINVCYL
jgi:hypothetical protein